MQRGPATGTWSGEVDAFLLAGSRRRGGPGIARRGDRRRSRHRLRQDPGAQPGAVSPISTRWSTSAIPCWWASRARASSARCAAARRPERVDSGRRPPWRLAVVSGAPVVCASTTWPRCATWWRWHRRVARRMNDLLYGFRWQDGVDIFLLGARHLLRHQPDPRHARGADADRPGDGLRALLRSRRQLRGSTPCNRAPELRARLVDRARS